ncbi:MAG: hypothetical protein KDG52_16925 [Rhodocyclaceae bacterium]|nr:hypothetical protein [Rhodocyclaceae bacterium]
MTDSFDDLLEQGLLEPSTDFLERAMSRIGPPRTEPPWRRWARGAALLGGALLGGAQLLAFALAAWTSSAAF